MKIVNITGGLGNQMLQYAFACKLKHLFPSEKILLDLTNFKGYEWHSYELDYVFDVKIPVASSLQVCRFTIPFSANTNFGSTLNKYFGRFFIRDIYEEKNKDYFLFNPAPFAITKSCYYSGYWFNEGYFSDIKDEILNVFSFKRPLNSYSLNLKKQIESTNSVSIHVRRGNYLLFDEYKNICERPYYEKAIKYMKEHVNNPHFFVFSNDIQWCQENLGDLMDNYTFSENNDPQNNYIDMQLMSCCKHNIIAHSSFSWWGAWLNNNEGKIVVAPYKWKNSEKVMGKPQLDSWILIDQNEK